MFDAFPQSPHGEFKPTFYNPFEVKHRRRTSRYQLKSLEKTFTENPKPHSSVRQLLAQKLNMTPRGVQVWFQNRRAKAKKIKYFDGDQSDVQEGLTPESPFEQEPEDPFSNHNLAQNCSTDDCLNNILKVDSCEDESSLIDPQKSCSQIKDEQEFSCSYDDPFYSEEHKPVLVEQIVSEDTESSHQKPKTSLRSKPNIEPIQIPGTNEEFQFMVQQRQFPQVEAWVQQHMVALPITERSPHPDYLSANEVYDSIDQTQIMPIGSLLSMSLETSTEISITDSQSMSIGTPQSNHTIPDYFDGYNNYSPTTVRSVISEDTLLDDQSDPFDSTSINHTRRNSCPPELMTSFMGEKIVSETDRQQQALSTIIEDQTFYNDSNMHHFLAVPAQVKRRFSEPANFYSFSQISEYGDAEFISNPTDQSGTFSFDIHHTINESEYAPQTGAQYLRGQNLNSTFWGNVKDNQFWNNGIDLKSSKVSIIENDSKIHLDCHAIGSSQWNQLNTTNIHNGGNNPCVDIQGANPISFMQTYDTRTGLVSNYENLIVRLQN
ncbi:hypothetical protein G9A89_015664 [Geosiphon pyriformis]|nr:hypothetical protein G9A89_015664 [Geosiphon pyriformis]